MAVDRQNIAQAEQYWRFLLSSHQVNKHKIVSGQGPVPPATLHCVHTLFEIQYEKFMPLWFYKMFINLSLTKKFQEHLKVYHHHLNATLKKIDRVHCKQLSRFLPSVSHNVVKSFLRLHS